MSNEKISQLPTVTAALASDLIYAVQAGESVQETLQQVLDLVQSEVILSYAGDPNGHVAGSIYILCYDSTNHKLYICTVTGSSSTAVWTLIGALVVAPGQGGSGQTSYTDGQLLIGNSTGNTLAKNTIIPGANITVTNGPGTITISSSGGVGFSWTAVTGTTQAMLESSGYVANNAALVTFTLPMTASFGTEIILTGKGAGGWLIAQNANQSIVVGSSTSTTGVGGSVASSNRKDSIILTCTTADLEWTALSVIGNLTIV